MRENAISIPDYLVCLVESLRARLRAPEFLNRHRRRSQDFTRERCLTFSVVVWLIFQKSLKSVQCHLQELLAELAGPGAWRSATAGAFTQARAKLLPSAFEELNSQCVLPLVYGPEPACPPARWRGHRLLGLDSSLVRLPHSPELAQSFRGVEVRNQQGAVGLRYCEGRVSVLYDLLNHLGLDGRLVSGAVGEVALAQEQLAHLRPGDLTLTDCGYTGYRFLAQILQAGGQFVSRCSRGSFLPAQELFRRDRAGKSVRTRLRAPADQRQECQKLGLPLDLLVRFVSLRLPDGKLEVLVTSLVEEQAYPTQEFGPLYHRRWGHEGFHFLLKSRLDLENWSGQTAQAIQQDFAATLLLANLESLLTRPAAAALAERSAGAQTPRQLNRAVSYHAIKDRVVELLQGDQPVPEVIGRLQQLFLASPVRVRDRPKRRRKRSWGRSYHFQRNLRKIVF